MDVFYRAPEIWRFCAENFATFGDACRFFGVPIGPEQKRLVAYVVFEQGVLPMVGGNREAALKVYESVWGPREFNTTKAVVEDKGEGLTPRSTFIRSFVPRTSAEKRAMRDFRAMADEEELCGGGARLRSRSANARTNSSKNIHGGTSGGVNGSFRAGADKKQFPGASMDRLPEPAIYPDQGVLAMPKLGRGGRPKFIKENVLKEVDRVGAVIKNLDSFKFDGNQIIAQQVMDSETSSPRSRKQITAQERRVPSSRRHISPPGSLLSPDLAFNEFNPNYSTKSSPVQRNERSPPRVSPLQNLPSLNDRINNLYDDVRKEMGHNPVPLVDAGVKSSLSNRIQRQQQREYGSPRRGSPTQQQQHYPDERDPYGRGSPGKRSNREFESPQQFYRDERDPYGRGGGSPGRRPYTPPQNDGTFSLSPRPRSYSPNSRTIGNYAVRTTSPVQKKEFKKISF